MPVTIIFSGSETFRSYVKSLLERDSTVIDVSDEGGCLAALKAHADAALVLDVHSKLPAFTCDSLPFLETMAQEGFGNTRVILLTWLTVRYIFKATKHSPFTNPRLSTLYRDQIYFFRRLPVPRIELLHLLGLGGNNTQTQ